VFLCRRLRVRVYVYEGVYQHLSRHAHTHKHTHTCASSTRSLTTWQRNTHARARSPPGCVPAPAWSMICSDDVRLSVARMLERECWMKTSITLPSC
jgi:hypothetical protein